MGTTTPDGLGYPDVGYTGGLRLAIKNLADTVQTALLGRAGRTFRPADAAAKTALASTYTLRIDDRAYQVDTGVTYWYSGSAWVAVGVGASSPYLEMTNVNSIANNTITVLGSTSAPTVPWVEVADARAWHDASTNPTRITPNIPGRYQIIGAMGWASNGTGARYIALKFNGAAYLASDRTVTSAAVNGDGSGQIVGERTFNGTTDYLEIEVYQSSGGALVPAIRLNVRFMGPS